MFLKELEICGFKSFAKKTKLYFRDGVTGIVGPNGCGKSNIIDAVRWVLGEQNIRSLRGVQITDIIFSGNHKNKSLNMAEVSILLDNSQKYFPLDWEEINIKRRIYRSGEVENFINGIPCKLKDIQELFMNTGLGRNAYSIIAQGEIEMVLSAKPADRRYLFEEAAAISKYKYEKQKTLKNTQEVEENLNRVYFMLSEVENNLKIYAEEAENLKKYKLYQQEIKDLELYLIAQKYHLYKNNLLKGEKKVGLLAKNRENILSILKKKEEELNAINQELNDLEKKKERCIKEKYELEAKRNEIKNKYLIKSQKKDDLKKRLFVLQLESEKIESKINILQQNNRDIDKQLNEIEKNKEEADYQFKRLKTDREKYIKFLKNISSLENNIEKNIYTCSQKKMFYHEKEIKYNTTITLLKENQKKISDKKNLINQQIKKLNQEKENCQKFLRESEEILSNNNLNLRKIQEKIKEIEYNSHQLLFHIRKDKQEVRLKEERKNILLRLLRDSLVLSEEDEATFIKQYYHFNPEGNCDRLIKFIEFIPEEYEKIIEIALRDKINIFVVDKIDHQFSIFNYLSQDKIKKIKIIPLRLFDKKNYIKVEKDLKFKNSKIIGFADELIKCKEKYKELFHNILGKTLILKDKSIAFDLYSQFIGKYEIITLDGLLIELDGTISCFDFNTQNEKTNIFYLQRKINYLNQEIEDLQTKVKDNEFYLKENEGKYNLLLQERKHLNIILEDSKRAIRDNYVNLNKIILCLDEAKNNVKNLFLEEENLLKEKVKITKKCQLFNFVSINLEMYIKKIENNLKLIKETNSRRGKLLNEISNKLSFLEKSIALDNQECNNLKDKKENFNVYFNEYLSDLKKQKDLMEEYKQEINLIKNSEKEFKIQLKNIEGEVRTANWSLEKIQKNIYEKNKLLEINKNEEEQLLKNLEQNKDEFHREDLLKVQYQEKCKIIEEDIKNVYKINIQDLNYYTNKASSQKDANQKIDILRNNILNMGKINFEAENRYHGQLARYDNLRKKYDEIFQAKKILEKMGYEVDKLAKKRFIEVFEQARLNFKKFFTELFGGGEADLYFEERDDIFQSGINIIAHPPGKDNRNIELLSSGEKSITAMALLLSLWKVNPSPFCFFDEIDTSLDELNAERLSSLLKGEELRKSQLIIITHQKSTIEAADSLYGITMEETGVSKVVSVKLNQ